MLVILSGAKAVYDTVLISYRVAVVPRLTGVLLECVGVLPTMCVVDGRGAITATTASVNIPPRVWLISLPVPPHGPVCGQPLPAAPGIMS